MLGFRSIAGTGLAIYAMMALTLADALWITRATPEALHQVFVIWMIAAAFVGVINWIFES